MFFPDRTALAESLRRLRERLCVYMSPDGFPDHGCDCKYGASGIGEQTGCPEAMAGAVLLAEMTDAEWAAIHARLEARAQREIDEAWARINRAVKGPNQ